MPPRHCTPEESQMLRAWTVAGVAGSLLFLLGFAYHIAANVLLPARERPAPAQGESPATSPHSARTAAPEPIPVYIVPPPPQAAVATPTASPPPPLMQTRQTTYQQAQAWPLEQSLQQQQMQAQSSQVWMQAQQQRAVSPVVFTGPRGGRYYYTRTGNKRYVGNGR